MLAGYRLIYGLILAVFFANLITTIHPASMPTHVTILTTAAVLSACSVLVLVLRFASIRPFVFWVFVLIWEALFVWYSWFSLAAPFAMHELHSFDPTTASREAMAHFAKAVLLCAALIGWFLSLPIIRQFVEKSARITANNAQL